MEANNTYQNEALRSAYASGYEAAGYGRPEDSCIYEEQDNITAWQTGWSDFHYTAAPVDWVNLDWSNPANRITVWDHQPDPVGSPGVINVRLLLNWTDYMDSRPEDEKEAPAWAANRPIDRSIPLDNNAVANIMFKGIHRKVSTIELPCPPYEYSYSEGGMTISAGVFHKWGSKDDWDTVITEMREKLDEAPAGLDVSEVTVNVDVRAQATAMWTSGVSATQLLAGDDKLDGDTFYGTTDELYDALADAISSADDSEFSPDYEIPEYEIDGYTEYEREASDLTYDIQDAMEA